MRRNADSAFVLLAGCASLAPQAEQREPAVPAMLTASVSPPSELRFRGDYAHLRRYLRSPAGRAAMARDGQAGSVRVLSTRRRDGMLLVKVRDTSPALAPALAREYWRAMFAFRGRILSLGVLGFVDRHLSNMQSRRMLRDFAGRIRAANVARQPARGG